MAEKNQTEKIQKVLARTGLGSRRQIEEWIKAGRVEVDGQLAELGDRISIRSKIKVDNKPIKLLFDKESIGTTRLILYHKPVGEICTRHDPEGRRTVFDSLPELTQGRWVSIGRLDINTSGLLLFTNDGELANRLMHPSRQIDREYAVRLRGHVNEYVLNRLLLGVKLEDGLAKFDRIEEGGGSGANQWYRVIVKEGRNRIVRRLWESQGITVSRLMRVRFGPVSLDKSLSPGQWIDLSPKLFAQYINSKS